MHGYCIERGERAAIQEAYKMVSTTPQSLVKWSSTGAAPSSGRRFIASCISSERLFYRQNNPVTEIGESLVIKVL
jgi:hypothetical protein